MGYPMGRVRSSGHPHSLDCFQNIDDLNQLRIRCVKLNAHQSWKCTDFAMPASARLELAYTFASSSISTIIFELLCSKSRVAPLKTVLLPQLELLAALLLARLINKVRESLEFSKCPTYLWSNSIIALKWITSPSRWWSVFVANRMDEIQRLTEVKHWRHVAFSDNSADILLRELNPCDLSNAERWWNGPEFLKWDERHWPHSVFTRLDNDLSEQRKIRIAASISHSCIVDLLNKYSNLNKICRIIAYCLRLFKAHRVHAISDFVSPVETSTALNCICRTVQQRTFYCEYQVLVKNEIVNTSSKIFAISFLRWKRTNAELAGDWKIQISRSVPSNFPANTY